MRRHRLLLAFAAATVIGAALLGLDTFRWIPRWLVWLWTVLAALLVLHELLGRPLPFLRWSFLRMLVGMNTLLRDWQVGDGREEGAARHVLAHAPRGDVDAAIRTIDDYARRKSFLINVGDEKGAILDGVIERLRPQLVLEVGAYVGYSALRMASKLPAGGRLVSVEYNDDNASIARRIVEHAGAADRVTFVVGTLGDGGTTLAHLAEEHGFASGSLDVVFLDHDKDAYLPDLQRLLDAGWLHPGSVVVADNVGFPGAPEYRAYMESEEGKTWRTRVHQTHVEYQKMIPDVVLESALL
jgi:catechol O-methyltransferase